ncbi:carbonic anhydrase [Kamptonema formosum]|uniref:carbonic anhydrase n=1 Tax=Kamptonema formosum TaxID=331992 RepID=UPI0003467322|nr:carbonic anhydrase [Oscillatoria sp. PCC 10802]
MPNTQQLKVNYKADLPALTGASGLVAIAMAEIVIPETAIPQEAAPLTGDEALQKLMAGNKRYVEQKRTYPDQTPMRLAEVAKGQHPFAILLGCADSRVPPEILFDQGLGDLFVIRVAGNILDDAILGSIEYATAVLGVPLIMVLGHERCGAVKAALDGKPVPGHIFSFVDAIKPAVDKAKGKAGDALDNAVKANIIMVVEQLKSSQPILADLVQMGQLKIVGARYDLATGQVELVP